MTRPLCTAFRDATPAGSLADPERLERTLAEAAERGSRAWPGVRVDAAVFARFLGERVPAGGDPIAMLAELRLEELYLCCACLAGSAPAIAELDRRFVTDSARALGRFGGNAESRDEALQRAREKLLAGATPKLAQYSGKGALGGWIRVVVVRTALNTQRTEKRYVPRDDDVLARASPKTRQTPSSK